LKREVDRLDPKNRIDPHDPAQFKELLKHLNQGEDFFLKGGADSELRVRGKIRNARAIFVHGTPAAEVIEKSLAELRSGLEWAQQHGIIQLENDAWWGIYLCNSRLKRPSEAADALIQLRTNLEGLRRGIQDPRKRGGIFGTYRYLFHALCEQLQQAGRAEDLLEAIESSKGRVIADRLTAQTGDSVADAAIYGSVARLPDLTRDGQFHYLTYFVDEEKVYAVLVDKRGKIHAIEPIPIKNTELRAAAETVDPARWGQPTVAAPGARIQDVSETVAALVAWLDGLLEQGVADKGDHICYSSDDDFQNVPLQYLGFRDGILLDWFSLSRVHSAFHLEQILRSASDTPPNDYFGVVVPTRQDLESKGGEAFLANLEAPLLWLKGHRRNGRTVRLAEATLESVKEETLDHRIVHFSTHGWFPEQEGENPYHDSYLVLADRQGLPDKSRIIERQHHGKLTPSAIVDAELNFEGSHISVMACLSGLAKEGIAGDSLGLDWAFIQTGALSLISTHWKVSAACAAQFFTLFYQKWIEGGQTRASACRETTLELLGSERTTSSLQRWTAFSLTGDFR
jgi:CHAT domain